MSVPDLASAILRWIGGAIFPMFLRPTSPVGPAWLLHLILAAGAAVGLYFAQPHLGVTALIGHGPGWFRPFWLSAIFALVYALGWSAAWLWGLLAPQQLSTFFPDLDEAWYEVREALDKAGIGIVDTPLFLVFGEWAAGYEPFFRSLPHGLAVDGGTKASSPLRVYANREAIYVCLPGACLLGFRGQLNDMVGSEVGAVDADSVFKSIGADKSIGIGASIGAGIGASMGASIGGIGGPLQEIQKIIRGARDANRPLTDEEKARVRQLSGSAETAGGAQVGGGKAATTAVASVLQNPQVAGELAGRLMHVCGLIAGDRRPLCPINGAVIAVPMSATEKDEVAQQWGLVAREDLAITEYALKLRFPIYALVGGAEDLPGGRVFFERFGADKTGQRFGKGFPLNPDVPASTIPQSVEAVAEWVFGGLVPYHTMKLMRLDSDHDPKVNGDLVRFLADMRRRSGHLARLLSRAVGGEGERPPVFGGCYLAVVSRDNPNEAKFAKDFFAKVAQTQGYVAWTDEAFAEDRQYALMAKLGTLALVVLILGVLGLGGYVGYMKLK